MDEKSFLRRNRVAVLGGARVGKTSILMRFLHKECPLDHNETVEDLHCGQYAVKGRNIKIDFLDTAGTMSFPAMRSLAILNAQAFLLVYAINDEKSFAEVKIIWEEVKATRENYGNIPCVLIANKCDLDNFRKVETFYGMNWAFEEGLEGVFLEVSAKKDARITEIFNSLFKQFVENRSNIRVNAEFIAKRFGNVVTKTQIDKKTNIRSWLTNMLRGMPKEGIGKDDSDVKDT